jgi:hypothetical protein
MQAGGFPVEYAALKYTPAISTIEETKGLLE